MSGLRRKRRINPVVENHQENRHANLDEQLTSERKTVFAKKSKAKAILESVPPLSPFHPRFQLDPGLASNLVNTGITLLHTWQGECLDLANSTSTNLVYSAPTSAGKSLVAELLMIEKTLKTGSKSIYVLPYVSIVTEKERSLTNITKGLLRVGSFYGNAVSPRYDECDLFICTMEKANQIVNHFIKESRVEDIGLIAVDELHMAGLRERGYILEMLITKSLFVGIQIIAMSATLPNLRDVARWLHAEVFETTYRPVPLTEAIKLDVNIYTKDKIKTRSMPINLKDAAKIGDPDGLIALVYEVVSTGSSCLTFCATKKECENASKLIAKLLVKDPNIPELLVQARRKLMSDLAETPSGLDETLSFTIERGIAFHHSGLTTEERALLEAGFRNGIIHTICATSTLASGVNLPARRIIFRSPFIGRNFLSASEYQQMCGRAGRKGLDEIGESILMCTSKDFQKCLELMNRESRPLESCLYEFNLGLSRMVLEAISIGLVEQIHQLPTFLSNTLLAFHPLVQKEPMKLAQLTMDAISFLEENNFLVVDKIESLYSSTILSQATLASSLTPDDAIFVAGELRRDVNTFCVSDQFHAVYHSTPPFFYGINHDWQKLADLFNSTSISKSQKVVADLIGISAGLLQKLAFGARIDRADVKWLVHQRFANALILFDLVVKEVPFKDLCEKYSIEKGSLQQLISLSGTFNAQMISFCRTANFKPLGMLLWSLKERLQIGLDFELMELIKAVSDLRVAKMIYQAGIKTLAGLRDIEEDQLLTILKSDPLFSNLTRTELFKKARLIKMKSNELFYDGEQ